MENKKLTKKKIMVKLVILIISLILFIVTGIVLISKAISGEHITVFNSLGCFGTGYVALDILADIYVQFPEYMRAWNNR